MLLGPWVTTPEPDAVQEEGTLAEVFDSLKKAQEIQDECIRWPEPNDITHSTQLPPFMWISC